MTATNVQKPALAGYLINPTARTIERVEVDQQFDDEGDALCLEGLYKLIGCELVEALDMNDEATQTLWFDEEGRMKRSTAAQQFVIRTADDRILQPIFGRAVMLDNQDGEAVTSTLPDVEAASKAVWWVTRLGLIRADRYAEERS